MVERIKAADLHLATSKQGRIKGTQKTTVDGITFDSKREEKRWQELTLLKKAGHISELERQVKIPLLGRHDVVRTPTGRQMHYKADFQYWDRRLCAWVIEDAKGHATETYKMKKAILAAQGIEVEEV